MKKTILLIAIIFLAIFGSNRAVAESDTLWTKYIGSTVRSVKFSPDGRFVYAAADGRGPLKLDANSGEIITEYEGFKYTSGGSIKYSLEISKKGDTLYAGDANANIYYWDVNQNKSIGFLDNSKYNQATNPICLAMSISENYLAVVVNYDYSGQDDWTMDVQIWDLSSKTIIKEFKRLKTHNILFNNQSNHLAISTFDDQPFRPIYVYNTNSWEKVIEFQGHESDWVTDLSFSPDGSTLASCDEKYTKIWDIEKKELKINYKPESVAILSLHLISNNLLTLGNGDVDNYKLRTTELNGLQEIYSIPLVPIDFSYFENKKIAVADHKRVTLVVADRLSSIPFTIGKDKIFPNPASQNLTIPKTYFNENFLYFNIIDMTGKEVYRYNKTPNSNFNEDLLIDVSRYLKGSYIVQFFYTTNIQTLKFMKE